MFDRIQLSTLPAGEPALTTMQLNIPPERRFRCVEPPPVINIHLQNGATASLDIPGPLAPDDLVNIVGALAKLLPGPAQPAA